MPDTIEHGENGYLVQPYEIEDLAKGIAWVFEC
jgi:glycosyltransferase involved in cell wall biosynthesis